MLIHGTKYRVFFGKLGGDICQSHLWKIINKGGVFRKDPDVLPEEDHETKTRY